MHYMYSLVLQVPVMTSVSVGYKLCRVHTQVCRCLHNISLCACRCLHVLRMVSPDKILCCKNTLITILIVFLFMCNVLRHLVFVLKFYCHCTMLWAPPPPPRPPPSWGKGAPQLPFIIIIITYECGIKGPGRVYTSRSNGVTLVTSQSGESPELSCCKRIFWILPTLSGSRVIWMKSTASLNQLTTTILLRVRQFLSPTHYGRGLTP